MDEIDHQIIARLTGDARTPHAHIAKDLGLAPATVHQRVKRLVESGVIQGSRTLLDWEAVGLPVVALVSVSVGAAPSIGEVATALESIDHIQSCYAVTGEFDLLLVVRARSSSHLGELLEGIRRVTPGMSRTVVVLQTFFDGRMPPLDADSG